MSLEENRALARRIVEEMWNTHNLRVIDEVYSPTFGEQGHAGSKQWVTAVLAAIPDLHNTILDQVAENDLVATRYLSRGTQLGPIGALQATGKQFEVMGIEMHRFVNGQLTELWNVIDNLSMLRQMGVIPE